MLSKLLTQEDINHTWCEESFLKQLGQMITSESISVLDLHRIHPPTHTANEQVYCSP